MVRRLESKSQRYFRISSIDARIAFASFDLWSTIPRHGQTQNEKAPPLPSSRKSSSRARSKKTGKLPKDAVALAVVMHAKPGQELLLQAELSALIRPTRKEEGCLLYDLHRSPTFRAIFYFLKFGPAAKLTPNTSAPRISCAGTPAKTHFWPPANQLSGRKSRRFQLLNFHGAK